MRNSNFGNQSDIKLILFDLGGVLLDINFQRVLDYWSSIHGEPISVHYDFLDDELYRQHEIGAIDFDEYYQHINATLGLSLSKQQCLHGWNKVLVGIAPGIETILEKIDNAIPLVIFSNTNRAHENYWRREFSQLWPYFDSILTSHCLKVRKPDVCAYLRVLETLNVGPQQVIFFDDSIANIEGAKSAGIEHSYFITNSEGIRQVLQLAGLFKG